MKRAPRGYQTPVQYRVYLRENGRTRKVCEFRLPQNFQDRMSACAEATPEAQIYVCRRGEWFKMKFEQERNEKGQLTGWSWEMVPSEGITDNA